MKKDRNCGMTPYPVYSGYQTMPAMPIPNMMAPMPGAMIGQMPTYQMDTTMTTTNQTQNSSIDGLQNQINMLDRRITKLESMVNSTSTFNTNFSDSNYHVM